MTTKISPGGGRFPGLRGFVLLAMLLGLSLGFDPGATSFSVIKGVIFLCLPVLAWCSSPLRLSQAFGSEVSKVSGGLVILLLLWVGYGEYLHPGGAQWEQLAYLTAGWFLLLWFRSLKDEELDSVLRGGVPLVLVLVGAVALVQVFAVPGTEMLRFPGMDHPVGTLGNRNQLAYFMALGIPEAFTLMMGQGSWEMLLGGCGGAVGLVILVLVGCRGAWLALGLGMLTLFLVPASTTRRKLSGIVFGVFLLAAALAPLGVWKFQRPLRKVFSPQKRTTMETRLFCWENTVEGIKQGGWLGKGPGSFPQFYPLLKEARMRKAHDDDFVEVALRARVKRQAHHEVLELGLEWGGVGVALFSLLVLAWVLDGIQSLAGVAGPGTRRRRRLGMAMVVAGVVSMGFHFPLQSPALTFLILLGLARFLGGYRDSMLRSTLWVFPTMVLAGGCLVAGARLWMAERSMQVGLGAMQGGRFESAEASFREAIRLRSSGRAYNGLGRLLLSAGKKQDAINLFRMAEVRDPSFGHALNVGSAEFSRGQMEVAKEAFLRAWFRQPNQETGFLLGALYEHGGRGKDAEGVYRRARKLSGYSGRPGYSLARLLWKRGRRSEAARILTGEVIAATAALKIPGPGFAQIARMRLACLSLLLKIHKERKDRPAFDAVLADLKRLEPGLKRSQLPPPGQKEGIL
jgi:tetratricopeptide (TPR) repeat protein